MRGVFNASKFLPAAVDSDSVVHMTPSAQRLELMAQEADLVLHGEKVRLEKALSRHFDRLMDTLFPENARS